MESRIRHLANQSLQRKSQLGQKIKDAGAHIYHAATGVSDGNIVKVAKRHRLKKAFARYRGWGGRDEATHHGTDDFEHRKSATG